MLRGVKRGEPAICNRSCNKEDLSCEIEDEHAHFDLGCREILLSTYNDEYQAKKENRDKDGDRTIHDSLPNVKVSYGSQPPMTFVLSFELNGWLPFAAPSCWLMGRRLPSSVYGSASSFVASSSAQAPSTGLEYPRTGHFAEMLGTPRGRYGRSDARAGAQAGR